MSLQESNGGNADAIVIGGGIGGLAAAVALKTIGGLNRIHVYERLEKDAWNSAGTSTGLSLFPNGMAALEIISPDIHRAVLDEVSPVPSRHRQAADALS